MHKIFIGYDERQPVSFTVLSTSLILQASEPVAITPIRISQVPLKRTGLTPFTYSRFMVPYLCGYQGHALFMDIDMAFNGDVAELMRLFDPRYAVQVSKNPHRFEWASLMLFNCAHPSNAKLTPEFIETAEKLHGISWCKEGEVGDLPREWNHLVGYDAPRNDAKLVHYTQGVPAYPETDTSEYVGLWRHWATAANTTMPWSDLMGESVHSVDVNGKRMPKYLWDLESKQPRPEHAEKIRSLLGEAA